MPRAPSVPSLLPQGKKLTVEIGFQFLHLGRLLTMQGFPLKCFSSYSSLPLTHNLVNSFYIFSSYSVTYPILSYIIIFYIIYLACYIPSWHQAPFSFFCNIFHSGSDIFMRLINVCVPHWIVYTLNGRLASVYS